MATYTWRASNGAFGTASNWDLGGVPSTGDIALFNSTPATISGDGSVDTINFSAAGWSVGGQLTANAINILNGLVTLNGSTARFVVGTAFGVNGGATLNIINGAALAVTPGGAATFTNANLNVSALGIASVNGPLRLGAGGGGNALLDAAVMTVGGVFALGTTAGSVGNLTVQNRAQAIVNAARDDTTSYLQLGAAAGATGRAVVSGSGSLLLMSQNSSAVGFAGAGELVVANGGSARFNSGNNAQNPALVVGAQASSSGAVTVSGAGSTLVSGGSVIVGRAGSASFSVGAGASVSSAGLTSTQAALSVGASPSGAGTLTIEGAGAQFIASGAAVIGGDNRGTGFVPGGAGTIAVRAGGVLQTNSMSVLAGSSVSVDGASVTTIFGDLGLGGAFSSAGSVTVSGTLSGGGTLTLGGGVTTVGTLAQATVAFAAPNTTLRVGMLSGTSQVTGLQAGDRVDLVGATAIINGNTVSTPTGTLVLAGAGAYSLALDGNGGTFVTNGIGTVGVFRFFDSNYGTHFFSSSSSEKNTIITTRPDLVYEGVGLESIDPAASDPNAANVYRFFDLSFGTHFFTASAAERDAVIASRSDLVYEGSGFIEHTTSQPGDVGVYRFFDTNYGTHFYTADVAERNMIVATRSDLVDEGIGFYAPGG